MKNKELHKELKEQAPTLAGLKKKSLRPELPEGYFEQLRKEVRAQLETRPQTPAGSTGKVRRLSFSPLRIAAAVGLLLGISALLFYFLQGPSPSGAGKIASAEEIEAYVFTHLDEFDEDLLIEYYVSGVEQAEQNSAGAKEQDPFRAIPDEELDEYLDDILDEIDETTLESFL